MDEAYLQRLDTYELYDTYAYKFGRTLTWLKVSDKPELKQLLIDAILGRRGVVRDEDLGAEFPPDALT